MVATDLEGNAYVRCVDCGLMAMRYASNDGQHQVGALPVVDAKTRDGWENNERVLPLPVCVARQRQFGEEFKARVAENSEIDVQLAVAHDIITGPFPCGRFLNYIPTFSPKEHLEIQRDDWLRNEVRRREDQRDVRADQAQKDQLATLRGHHFQDLLILGGAVVLATLIGSMIQAGWIGRPW